MELAQLRAFLAVVEHGGFRRAAAHLHYSQPALTRQVALLEQVLGVSLLVRGAGGAVPTAAGRRFAEHAQRVLDEVRDAACSVRGRAERRVLVLGVCPGGAAELTRPLLVELDRLVPEVRLVPRPLSLLGWSPDLQPGVDLAILRDPVRDDLVAATTLLEEPLMVSVPRSSGVVGAPALSPEEVLALPLVGFHPDVPRELRDFWSLADVRNGADADFRGSCAYDPWSTVRAVGRGQGAALATAGLGRTFAAVPVPLVPVTGRPPARVVLASRREDHRPLLDLVHAETARIVRRLAPLVLPAGSRGRPPGAAGRMEP